MKKVIILAVCCLLSALSVSAQRTAMCYVRDSVKIIAEDSYNINGQRFTYGLYKDEEMILPVAYDMVEESSVRLFAFFKDMEILVYDTNGNLVDKAALDFAIDHRSVVVFEVINGRRGENVYELVVYFNDNSWAFQSIGTYCRRKGHLYKVKISTEYELIE
jgi:hypothetical protein